MSLDRGDWIVRPFRESDAEAFARLNFDWIEQYFTIEDSDRAQLSNPKASIIDQGGAILIAEWRGTIVATGALTIPHWTPDDGARWLEVVKMATSPTCQGKGIGGAVLDGLIVAAREMGATKLWLETNASLEAAVRLYERKDFRHLDPAEIWPTPYERCNCQMSKDLFA